MKNIKSISVDKKIKVKLGAPVTPQDVSERRVEISQHFSENQKSVQSIVQENHFECKEKIAVILIAWWFLSKDDL